MPEQEQNVNPLIGDFLSAFTASYDEAMKKFVDSLGRKIGDSLIAFRDGWRRVLPMDKEAVAEKIDADRSIFDFANHILTIVALWAAVMLGWKFLPNTPIIPYATDNTSISIGLYLLTAFAGFISLKFFWTTSEVLRIIAEGWQRSPWWLVKILSVIPRALPVFILWGVVALIVAALQQT